MVIIREISVLYENKNDKHDDLEPFYEDSPKLLEFKGELGLLQYQEMIKKLKELDTKFKKLPKGDVFVNDLFEIY